MYLVTFLPSGLMVVAAASQPWVSVADLFQDPFTVIQRIENVRAYAYYGLMSNLGVLLWCAGASICFFTAMSLISLRSPKHEIAFLLSAGLLTSLLMFDDLFLGHEVVYRYIFFIPEEYTFLIYMIAVALYLMTFRRLIMRLDFEILAIGLGLLGLSILVDSSGAHADELGLLIEDGAKFLGIAFWTAFHFRAAWWLSMRRLAR